MRTIAVLYAQLLYFICGEQQRENRYPSGDKRLGGVKKMLPVVKTPKEQSVKAMPALGPMEAAALPPACKLMMIGEAAKAETVLNRLSFCDPPEQAQNNIFLNAKTSLYIKLHGLPQRTMYTRTGGHRCHELT